MYLNGLFCTAGYYNILVFIHTVICILTPGFLEQTRYICKCLSRKTQACIITYSINTLILKQNWHSLHLKRSWLLYFTKRIMHKILNLLMKFLILVVKQLKDLLKIKSPMIKHLRVMMLKFYGHVLIEAQMH